MFEDPGLGPFEPGQVQIHDFNPADLNDPPENDWFQQGGIFWTANVPKRSIHLQQGRGDAVFELNLDLFDFFDVPNALFRQGPPRLDANADVRIEFHGTRDRIRLRNRDAEFFARYERSEADVSWSATNAEGYSFRTVGEQNVAHAFIARVRSGFFFP